MKLMYIYTEFMREICHVNADNRNIIMLHYHSVVPSYSYIGGALLVLFVSKCTCHNMQVQSMGLYVFGLEIYSDTRK